MDEKLCMNCRHYERHTEDEPGSGFCLRYAPRPFTTYLRGDENRVDEVSYTWWPSVIGDHDRCGEFEPREAREAQRGLSGYTVQILHL